MPSLSCHLVSRACLVSHTCLAPALKHGGPGQTCSTLAPRQHLEVWACSFACLPYPRVTKWCPGHTCLKAFLVPRLPCGRLGMAVCTQTLLWQCGVLIREWLCSGILTCLFRAHAISQSCHTVALFQRLHMAE